MPPLPIGMNVRLSFDQRDYLEQIAKARDLTLSGAMRHVLDQALDAEVAGPGSPTRRELMHEERGEVVIDGQRVVITSIERASAPA